MFDQIDMKGVTIVDTAGTILKIGASEDVQEIVGVKMKSTYCKLRTS